MRFAINHISAPRLPLADFMAMCRRLGVSDIEIRNDIPDVLGSMTPAQVRAEARAQGMTILSINALYPFNVWSGDLSDRAQRMADYAAECGAQALVMCPLNDGASVAHSQVVAALDAMKPILTERKLTGLVEPLGFPVSSLRRKSEALAAMTETDEDGTFRLLHDTFHHYLSGEAEIYPARTAVVHLSGVTDPVVAVDDMLDGHRVLVDDADRLDNLGQIKALLAAGYDGVFSFEPFATEVHALDDPEAALKASMAHIRGAI